MKKYFNFTYAIVLLCAVFMLSACGGSGKADAEYEGKYISVAGEAMGMTLTGEDINGFGLELKNGGKGTMTIYGDSGTIKWTNDDENITVNIDGTDIVGAIGQDTITFDNVLDMGLKLTFAKEGSEAAKPENHLPETDKKMLGIWQSNTVTDVLGDPVEGLSGNELKMEFAADYTVKVTFKGNDLGSHKWSLLGDWGSLDSDVLDISWDINDNGINVNYSTDEDYFVFSCTKQS
ncbi:MAG: hypothetical protein ACLRQ0_03095 [Monoglobales bacterium]